MSPVPPNSEGYVPPVFPAFPFKVEVVGRPTLRSFHASDGKNLGQVPEGTIVWAMERDGSGEFGLWLHLKDCSTNDYPLGRDGWVLARNCNVTTGDVTPPPVEPPATMSQLEATMGTQFVALMRTVRAYIQTFTP